VAKPDPVFSPDAVRQLKKLRAYEPRAIIEGVRRHLIEAKPDETTRNMFRLRRSSDVADYELRVGDLRLFYRIEPSGEIIVTVIGVKEGDKLFVGRGIRAMKIAPLYEVKNRLSELVKETEAGPIVITRNGKPCAALVHLAEDEDMESFMLSHSPRFLKLLDRAAERTRREGGTPLSELEKEATHRRRRRRGVAKGS
jgi:prevent-host-death family protein